VTALRIVVLAGLVATYAIAVAPAAMHPAVSEPDETAAPGEFVWHDLVTPDPAAAAAFYRSMFGWEFKKARGVDPEYMVGRHDGQPVGGVVPLRRPGAIAQWIAYVVAADVDKAVEAFRHSGGRILREPLNARGDLRVAVVADAQGAPLGLANRGPRPAPGRPPALHRWLWMEYVALDADAALKFYGDILGYRHEVLEVRNSSTYYLLATDRPRAGLFRSPWERETSVWLPYVRVADPQAMADRAASLGARVVLPPRPHVRNGSLAIVLDPAGAPVALQKFPFDSGAAP
jgi:predicted enzyme related to lactoylglutathione lyase